VTPTTSNLQTINSRLQQRRAALAEMRNGVRARRAAGEAGIAGCHWLSDQVDEFIRSIVSVQQEAFGTAASLFAVVAVGGNGRRRPAPFSDIDLLFLVEAKKQEIVKPFLSAVVRDCWDAGVQLGSSIRTPSDVVKFAGEDVQFATSLIETRLLTGDQKLLDSTLQQVRSKVFGSHPERLILKLVASRREEWTARGNSVNQLEPDIKRSPGGLRDLMDCIRSTWQCGSGGTVSDWGDQSRRTE
jgi:[protein-PII] uridylyltransferase